MPLTENEKAELAEQAQLLIDAGEPEALLATLQRVCAGKGRDRTIPHNEGERWRTLAVALLEAETTVTASQSPEARKPQSHMAQWTPSETDGPQSPPDTPSAP